MPEGGRMVFKLLKRKFYSVLIVIFILLIVIMVSAYLVIEKALVSDYTSKTADIARKTTNDFQIKTDYAEYIASIFINKLMEKTDENGRLREEDFNADISKIKIYDSDIDGLGIFWDNGSYFVSATDYVRFSPELNEMIKKANKEKWVVLDFKENGGYIFLLIPINNKQNMQEGFALVDVSSLKKTYKAESLFFKDAITYLQTNGDRLYLSGEKLKNKSEDGMLKIKEDIQSDLKIVMKFPMTEINERLFHVKIFLMLFGTVFAGLSVLVVHNMVRRITGELEILKNEIDTYAKEGNKKIMERGRRI